MNAPPVRLAQPGFTHVNIFRESELAEQGGPTTQSGIFYQNSVAALYLGGMLDVRTPAGRARINAVRVEAPTSIDDIVVTFSDQSVRYIQAKESLTTSGEVWTKLWQAVREQGRACSNDRDEFRLVIGNVSGPLEDLHETVERSRGKENFAEWRAALNKEHTKILDSVLKEYAAPDDEVFSVVRRMYVEFLSLDSIESAGIRNWIPASSTKPLSLFTYLRDLCGGGGRVRQTFQPSQLSEKLLADHGVRIHGTHGDGLETYRTTICTQLDHITIPGTAISAPETALFVWPTISEMKGAGPSDFEDEDVRVRRSGSNVEVDLCEFPSTNIHRIVLESGAGFGKTTILRATARRLAQHTAQLPALILADALQEYDSIDDYLNKQHNKQYQVNIDWRALCEQGRAVLLIDGLDELNDQARMQVRDMLVVTAARFPKIPVLIAARDAALAAPPPGFRIFHLQRLDHEQRRGMLAAYANARRLDSGSIIRHVESHQELELLCSVPLMLAIFIATLGEGREIPSSRAELVERFVARSLAPEKFKANSNPSPISKATLRRGAEIIALLSLTRLEASVPQRIVQESLETALGPADGDVCVDTLVRFGLLQRRGTRIAFSVPTVQEYLAAGPMSGTQEFTSGEWLRNVYRRPWAQALQYAIERLPDASRLLEKQLRENDDLYHTSLRFVARCVVNGARVSAELKSEIAGRLAAAWVKSDSKTSGKIGRIIADGFFSPLHPDLRILLSKNAGDLFEIGEILRKVDDSTLTLEALDSLLAQNDIRSLRRTEWKAAIRPCLSDAIDRILHRARQEGASTLSASVVAEVIFDVKDERQIDLEALVNDSSLPNVVRATAGFGSKTISAAAHIDLIEATIDEPGSYLWTGFCDAYLQTPWWRAHLAGLCRAVGTKRSQQLDAYLGSEGKVSDDLLQTLADLARDPATHPEHAFDLAVILGAMGVDGFEGLATDALDTATPKQIHYWLHNFAYFSEANAVRGLEIIRSRNFSLEENLELLDSARFNLMSKPYGKKRRLMLGGPFTMRSVPTAVENKALEWAAGLLEMAALSDEQRRDVILVMAECASDEALGTLTRLIEEYLDHHTQISRDDWSWVASSLNAISRSRRPLKTTRLWEVIEKCGDLPVYSLVREILERERAACYPKLINYFEVGSTQSTRGAIIYCLGPHAEREGLVVRIEGKRLSITAA